ncbi:MAG: TatD family hydrolase [Acidimicrobiia bacterium]|nr:TatD family hydrolase [Acidimicrobiia bacterium]
MTELWVDTHCHLQLDERAPADLLERAGNVSWLVAPGVDAASSHRSVELAARYDNVLSTAGLHPHDASRWDEQRAVIESLVSEVSAIGETGLDFYRNLSPKPDQVRSFVAQIELARSAGLPVIVHCRDAFSDVHDLLESHELGADAILHCWTGGPRWTRRFLDLGSTFSFAGPVAFETGDTVRRGAALVPPDRCLVETDTPYLAPPPHRGEPNEPAFVGLVGAALAAVWGMEVAEVAAVTSANAGRVFRR